MRSALPLAVACLIGLVGADAGQPAPARAETTGLTRLDKAMCNIADIPKLSTMINFVLDRASRGRVKGGMIPTFVVSSVQTYCNTRRNLMAATQAVSGVFKDQRRPLTVPSLGGYREMFARQEAEQIAAQLRAQHPGWRAGQVRTLVGRMCRDLRRNRDPIAQDLAPALPGAKLAMLGAVNGLVSATLRCRPPLSAPQVDYLAAAAFSYLAANTFRRDFEPPSVFFIRIHGVRYTDRLTRVTVTWGGFDRLSGISKYVLYQRLNGRDWQSAGDLRPTPTIATLKIREGATYQLAIQAVDDSGNRSTWAYSGVGRA